MHAIKNILTIDFEEWYQGLTSTSARIADWPSYEDRIVPQTEWLLQALKDYDAKATFFIIGQTARNNPGLIKKIAAAGHDIALHGDMHQKVRHMSREEFRADLARNYEAVERASGKKPSGYRAAYASISQDTDWLWEELALRGIKYDASVYPFRTPLYGMPDAPRFPYPVETAHGVVQEFPLSTLRLLGMNLPFSGGFYFRTLPYFVVKSATQHLNEQGHAVIFYFHPWEFDERHPVPDCVTLRERLSHYGFLKRNRKKFLRLLKDFRFQALTNATT